MRWTERFLRFLAIVVSLIAAAWGIYAVFRNESPIDRRPDVVAIRVLVFGIASLIFLRRATGRKMNGLAWGAYAFLCLDILVTGKSSPGAVAFATSAALALVGAGIEQWQRALPEEPRPKGS
jgi:hypothetical protein